MYVSSEGALLKVEEMVTPHLINALSKTYRDIFTAASGEEISKHLSNIHVLLVELDSRVADYILKKQEENNNGQ